MRNLPVALASCGNVARSEPLANSPEWVKYQGDPGPYQKPMKRPVILSICMAAAFVSCEKKKENPSPMKPENETTSASEIAGGPARAEAAASYTRPGLIRDLEEKELHFGDPVFIRGLKEEKELEVFVRHRESGKYRLFRTYPIAAASGVLGPKLAEGDRQVPEGFYFVPEAAMNPASQFHLSFNIGYPNAFDRELGRTGSAIMIHGNQVSIGCLAMTDAKMEEIYTLCAAAHDGGQRFFRVHIFPFRMTSERMQLAAGDPNIDFWNNLSEGYRWFEEKGVPPDTSVQGGRYRFQEEGQ